MRCRARAWGGKVEADIAPFRALLLGMFFMTVGFEIDLVLCFNNLPLVASLVSAGCVTRLASSRSLVAVAVVVYASRRHFHCRRQNIASSWLCSSLPTEIWGESRAARLISFRRVSSCLVLSRFVLSRLVRTIYTHRILQVSQNMAILAGRVLELVYNPPHQSDTWR